MKPFHLTLYRLNSKGKPIMWSIRVEKNVIETHDGQVGGKLKYTKDVVTEGKNIGRSNETTPEEQAMLMAERKIEMKRRKGYVEEEPKGAPKLNNAFFNNPPRNFVGPKPKSSLEDSKREKLEEQLVYTRKWNGMCVHIVVGTDGPKILTSNMDDKTEWFPWQVQELGNIPPGTWLMAEAVLDDDPDKMKTIFGAKAERGMKEQEDDSPVQFKVFNTVYYGGKPTQGMTYNERWDLARDLVWELEYFDVVEGLPVDDHEEALQLLRDNQDWEGLVIWDTLCTDVPVKWGGSSSRSGGAWKLKNFKEADLVIHKWETGRGKLNNDVATLSYGAYDKSGNLIHVGRGGSGLDGKLRKEIKESSLPLVAEVKYEELTKANKLRLPVILRIRHDKKPNECLYDDIR